MYWNSKNPADEPAIFRHALDMLNDAIMLFDAAEPYAICYCNQAAARLVERLGLAGPFSLLQLYPVPASYIREAVDCGKMNSFSQEIHLAGDVHNMVLSPLCREGAPGHAAYFLAQFILYPPIQRDDPAAGQQSLEYMAYHDALTGLPNRLMLYDRMTQAIAGAHRHEKLLAVLFLDLDGFKAVNDGLGHAAGDGLLKEVACRLKQSVRAEDTVARLGGDEFVVLLNEVSHMDDVVVTLDRIMKKVSSAAWPEGSEPMVSVSIGLTLYPMDDGDAETLLRHADLAMYQAKAHGRNQFQLFDVHREQALQAKQILRERLAVALRRNEFQLYYQPQVNMRTGEVVGVEALIRWQDPTRGLVSPDQFIPMAEESDLILGIGHWVLKEALKQVVRWREQGFALRMSVNVAARQFTAPGFVDELREMLERYEVQPDQLELEITESTALRDIEAARQIIDECSRLGVCFALDDFGTGYATLTYLKRLPAGLVKIDQSFVRHMTVAPDDVAIVEGIIAMASLSKRRVLAEGVETIEHGIILLRLGCDLAQGYAIARPMPGEALPDWLATWRCNPLWQDVTHVQWEIQDFPLLVAKHDHVLWVERVIRTLHDPAASLNMDEVTNHHQCGLGKWYDGEGGKRYGHLPAFHALGMIHREVHETGIKMLELSQSGDIQGAQRLAEKLLLHKTDVLEKLTELHDSVEQGRKV